MATCFRCDKERETKTHMVYFFDDRDPKHVEVCAPCTRKIRQDDDHIRSIM